MLRFCVVGCAVALSCSLSHLGDASPDLVASRGRCRASPRFPCHRSHSAATRTPRKPRQQRHRRSPASSSRPTSRRRACRRSSHGATATAVPALTSDKHASWVGAAAAAGTRKHDAHAPCRGDCLATSAAARISLTSGDYASARPLLQRAAEAGSASAALMLGATFDPLVVHPIGGTGIKPDTALARQWYEKAVELGSDAASQRLAKLPQTGQ